MICMWIDMYIFWYMDKFEDASNYKVFFDRIHHPPDVSHHPRFFDAQQKSSPKASQWCLAGAVPSLSKMNISKKLGRWIETWWNMCFFLQVQNVDLIHDATLFQTKRHCFLLLQKFRFDSFCNMCGHGFSWFSVTISNLCIHNKCKAATRAQHSTVHVTDPEMLHEVWRQEEDGRLMLQELEIQDDLAQASSGPLFWYFYKNFMCITYFILFTFFLVCFKVQCFVFFWKFGVFKVAEIYSKWCFHACNSIVGGPSTRITYHRFVQNSEDVACQDFKLKDMGWEDVESFY